jgi:hypothetical protein
MIPSRLLREVSGKPLRESEDFERYFQNGFLTFTAEGELRMISIPPTRAYGGGVGGNK